jgi:hypothetical protein
MEITGGHGCPSFIEDRPATESGGTREKLDPPQGFVDRTLSARGGAAEADGGKFR